VGQPPTSNTWGVDSPLLSHIVRMNASISITFFVFSLTPSDPPWIGVTVPWRADFLEIPHEKYGDFPGVFFHGTIAGSFSNKPWS